MWSNNCTWGLHVSFFWQISRKSLLLTVTIQRGFSTAKKHSKYLPCMKCAPWWWFINFACVDRRGSLSFLGGGEVFHLFQIEHFISNSGTSPASGLWISLLFLPIHLLGHSYYLLPFQIQSGRMKCKGEWMWFSAVWMCTSPQSLCQKGAVITSKITIEIGFKT